MTGLDERQRSVLERIVVSSRITLEDDLSSILKGHYGIGADGGIEDEDRLADDSSLRRRRRTLVEVVDYLRRDGSSGPEAVARVVREAAFTHINRLIAIRVADALGVLPPSLRSGPASSGFKQVLEVAPLLATSDDTGGYWTFLQLCADELARDVPALFDPRNPLLALRPTKPAIDAVVERLASNDHSDIWTADDTFGWAYQFFNTGDERRLMRDESPAPRDSRELAVRNQFFTPRYVVDFLVQNTLGRRLLDAVPGSGLADQLPLLLDPPVEPGAPLELDSVRALDPACGSGHFLLGCYEVLEKAWALTGVGAREAAPKIIPCLWGIDIDSRAVQVAQAALVFRARRVCGGDPLPPPNITTARSLPHDEALWATATTGLSAERRDLVIAIRDALAFAPVLGPLLRAEERLASEIRTAVSGSDAIVENLFTLAGIGSDAFGTAEREVLAILQRAADLAESSVADRLLAARAGDAIRFLEAIRHRYDVVLMNPPFGLPVPETETYLKANYRLAWTELYGAFTLRAIELTNRHGYVGSITSNRYFVTRKLRQFRKFVADAHRPVAVVELGGGVLQGATVDTACQVFAAHRVAGDTWYLDLSDVELDRKPSELRSRAGSAEAINLDRFAQVDGMPFAFHVDGNQIESWSKDERFEPAIGFVRTGGNTFDNFRFLRSRWEVSPDRIGSDWVPYQKGGEFQPYFATSHLVVDWRNDGEGLRKLGEERKVLPQVMQSSTHWRRRGLVYPRASSIAFGVRLMPAGEIFSSMSVAIFLNDNRQWPAILAFLNSSPTASYLETFGRGRMTDNGSIKSLPIGETQIAFLERCEALVTQITTIFFRLETFDETTAWFSAMTIDRHDWCALVEGMAEQASALQERIDGAVSEILDSSESSSSPKHIQSLIRSVGKEDEWAKRVLSYAVGLGFERWQPVVASREPPASVLQLEPTPVQPPGAGLSYWSWERWPQSAPLMVDDPTSNLDVVRLVSDSAEAAGIGSVKLDEACAILGCENLREYLRRKFFKDHVSRYSKSRRQAPVYWQLSVPSGTWSVWIYAPSLTRETIFAAIREADRRLALGADRLRAIQTEESASSRSSRQAAKVMDLERSVVEEVRELRDHLEQVARSGWNPDLDDGFVLCAAPFSRWLPKNAWKQAGESLDKIRSGEFDWSSIHEYRERL
jgi:hypothetical protein